MKKLTLVLGILLMSCASLFAQAPANCGDIMLQGFHWDSYGSGDMDKSYSRTKWTDLSSQVNDIAETFTMIWLPPSAQSSGGTGYHPEKWCNQSSDWGSKDQLKSLISAFHAKNCKVIADIVVNHKGNQSTWTNFYKETFGSESFQFDASHICRDDECTAKGHSATGNSDSGYGYEPECNGVSAKGAYCAARDLDHSNTYVQNAIKAYLKWLKSEIGYDGWRYDLVKGYWGGYTKIYNNAAGAYYSVGEYWDGNYSAVKQWIEDTGRTSTAFDFPNKYDTFNKGLASKNFGAMINGYKVPNGLCGADEMKRYATTFIDNHDTFRDGSKYQGDWTTANAVLLSQPGIPCVFYPHWEKCKNDIKKMVAARKAMGIHSQSKCTTAGGGSYYQSTTTGTKGTLICFIGSGWSAPSGYTKACGGTSQGTQWAYYTSSQVVVPDTPVGPVDPDTPTPSQSYAIRVNGTTDYPATYMGKSANSDHEEYMVSVELKAGDTFVTYDLVNKAGWVMTIEPYGEYANFTAGTSSVTCNVAGCYDFYIKMMYQNDSMYIGPGTGCGSVTPTPTPGLSTDYYLIGYINGADYASGETDWNITGDYKFVNGKVTVTFTETSYVYVKTGDLSGWFMAQEYVMPSESGASGTLYNTASDPLALEKIGVPAGTVTFTLVENANGSLTLSYTIGASAIIEAETVNMVIYPNPTSDYITISCDEAIEEVVINAINGSEVIRTNSNEIDLSALNPSMYFVNIMLQNGDVVRSKVIRK